MKRIILFLFLGVVSLFFSCMSEKHTSDFEVTNPLKTSQNFNTNELQIIYNTKENDVNNLDISIEYKNVRIDFTTNIEGVSTLNVIDSQISLFDARITIDPCFLKYRELSDNIVTEAKIIIQKVELEQAEQLNNILNEAIPIIVDDLYEQDNKMQQALLSNLFFQKAIITTSIRGLIDTEDCNCTPHPGHLVGKSYFACQEDIFYDYEMLKQSLIDYNKTVFEEDEKEEVAALITHINTFEGDKNIRFDDFYSFYIPKKDFMQSLERIENPTNSVNTLVVNSGCNRWLCFMGCGSDHGCCGNYSGCCYYRDVACYVHDKMCTTCTPKWFCGWACKPDKIELVPPCPNYF